MFVKKIENSSYVPCSETEMGAFEVFSEAVADPSSSRCSVFVKKVRDMCLVGEALFNLYKIDGRFYIFREKELIPLTGYSKYEFSLNCTKHYLERRAFVIANSIKEAVKIIRHYYDFVLDEDENMDSLLKQDGIYTSYQCDYCTSCEDEADSVFWVRKCE